MKNKENQRVRLTKTLLKNSLVELMGFKSIHKITIKELCENAGINRSTFYLYYKDQFALLEEIEADLLYHIKERVAKIDSNLSSLQYLQELLVYIKGNAEIFNILLRRLENSSFQVSFIAEATHILKLNLNLKCSEKIADYIYRYLTTGCLSMINKWMESGFDLSIEDLSHMMFQLSDSAVLRYGQP
ncbi:TetR/AcrR family transcriptional regulator [Paenibacillus lactis]|uniref:TetR/AcrR family transcriptional regulator n=1 Tax=Paenibacillus lactis TaxID=228574 RepID=UPI001B1E5B02|nr:TetR/AcrR family transcriptional regulator [Paenibacillus lactis]GIO92081.1 TetR family transcriptional regulator [Paenibacillus lactis]